MSIVASESEARKRILDAAYELFYRQGYKATGINQVIEVSGVAKATFYSHFPSKEDLGVAYVRERNSRETKELSDFVDKVTGPLNRFLAPMEVLIPWLVHTNYRGCPFQNIVIEFDDPNHPVHQEVKKNREEFRTMYKKVAEELKASDPVKYQSLDPEQISQTYMILVEGAVMLAVIRHDPQPIRDALQTLIRLIP